jgi:dienelactone hydrolase
LPPGTTTPGTPTSGATTTTTAAVQATTVPPTFGVGFRTLTFVDTTRPTLTYATSPPSELSPERTIVAQVRYPASPTPGGTTEELTRAAPANGRPFPVIVFAHGYAVMPNTYQVLLDAWVRAGFVVVSPVFPVTNYYEWLRQGGGSAPELDLGNQPYDVAFVIQRLFALATDPRSFLDGLIDPRRLGLAGQSDGASTVAALAYGSTYRMNWTALPVHPLALAVLSGAELGGSVSYSDPDGSKPAVLSAESDDDYCNPTQNATALYDAVARAAPAHWFLTLEGANHLAPYVGTQPWGGVVENVTTGFFELELKARVRPAAPADLSEAGDVGGVSELSTEAGVSLPETSASGDCGTPSPLPPA